MKYKLKIINNFYDLIDVFINRIDKFSLIIVFRYFTNWMILANILLYLGFLKKFQYSIFLVTTFVSLFGLFLVYIYPKYIYVPDIEISVEGTALYIFDIIFHHLPLLLLIYNYNNNIPKDNGVFALSLISVYLILFNPFKIYKFLNKK